jgi:hypothetical protein
MACWRRHQLCILLKLKVGILFAIWGAFDFGICCSSVENHQNTKGLSSPENIFTSNTKTFKME